ncbi:MAG: hypothetical protein P8Y47_12350 [Alphaproteobacteria bacterium]
MSWCEDNGVDYIFGFAGNTVLDRLVDAEADDIRTRRAAGEACHSARLCRNSLSLLMHARSAESAVKSWARMHKKG